MKFLTLFLFFATLLLASEPIPSGYHWELLTQYQDHTHRYLTYALYYQNRKVLDKTKKEIQNLKTGEILTKQNIENFDSISLTHSSFKNPYFRSKATPIIWVDPKNEKNKIPAQELRVFPEGELPRLIIVEESTGNILEEKKIARNVDASGYVFSIHPDDTAISSKPLINLDVNTTLKSSNIWVRYERATGASTTETNEVMPTTNYTLLAGYSSDPSPAQYTSTCTSATNTCSNQKVDAVNIYYHLAGYRDWLNTKLNTLGATVSFSYDPLNILVNPVSITSSSNNAYYLGSDCKDDGSMPRCILFLKPAALSSSSAQSNCGTSSAILKDFAREAIVVVHEYQHYVTDMITSLAFSSSSTVSFGDALHEGYSDYFAASYLSEKNNTTVSLVGDYSLQTCTLLQREVSNIRVLTNGSAERDPHTSGLSWASGLWQLREDYGAEVANLLAFKSLFFLSTYPGAFEAVESLVAADSVLYSGEHIDRIRQIFYDMITFTGGDISMFKDTRKGIVEVGLKGCASIHQPESSFLSSLLLFLIFLVSTAWVGRKISC